MNDGSKPPRRPPGVRRAPAPDEPRAAAPENTPRASSEPKQRASSKDERLAAKRPRSASGDKSGPRPGAKEAYELRRAKRRDQPAGTASAKPAGPGDVRAEAARALLAVIDGDASLERSLPDADARLGDPRDRALLRAILFAALRSIYRLRAVADTMITTPFKPRDRIVYALVLVGLAQLHAEVTPAYAAVGSTAEAARTLGRPTFVGLVNALMRRFQRERDALFAALPPRDSLQFDHPDWLVAKLRDAWPNDWRDIVAANNAPAPLWLRVNRTRFERDAYAAQLRDAGLSPQVVDGLPDALRLDDRVDVQGLPGFGDGSVSVQDGAAQLAVEVLAPAPNLRVLDACAAPGGKSAHLLEREPALAVTALEPYAARVARLRETLARLQLTADVREGDATNPSAWWDGTPYDRILIDAPCSGTGVIRRHPDIRLLRRESDVEAQVALQARLLDATWPLLAPGGRLVYATCSVLPDENALQIARFCERTADARALPDAVPAWFGRASGLGRQNLPGESGMDGFFYAVVEKSRG